MSKKATNIEIQQRIDIIYELILKGWGRKEIIRYGSEEWTVSERQIDKYLVTVKDELKKRSVQKKDHQFQLAIDRLEMIFKRSLNIQDYKECRQIQSEINKLYGLYPAEKRQIQINKVGADLEESMEE